MHRKVHFSMSSTLLHGLRLMAIAIALCLVCSCSLEDDRDQCCTPCNVMHYTYRPFGSDDFKNHISSLRHFLFDDAGAFIEEIAPGSDLQYQYLPLTEGDYTIVTLGNTSEASHPNHYAGAPLEEFTLNHTLKFEDNTGISANTDELFWGVKNFHVESDGLLSPATGSSRTAEERNTLVTPMNNIHCHLTVRVEWANLPQYIGDYEMELDGIATRYSLHPGNASDVGRFIVPKGEMPSVHRIRVPMHGRELLGEFITLRYSDELIPVFRLLYGSEQITPDIDLARAFRIWGWRPSETHIQEYSIMIRIFSNGSVDIYPSIDASVDDWIDGGIFS
ncbi:MAG: FimB/Mfa2 family fimbrial subunit [Bacteroidales bacterium]|nr:FimB/Mfa2 family fimbrial subunit [Bacteroidales bacterium]